MAQSQASDRAIGLVLFRRWPLGVSTPNAELGRVLRRRYVSVKTMAAVMLRRPQRFHAKRRLRQTFHHSPSGGDSVQLSTGETADHIVPKQDRDVLKEASSTAISFITSIRPYKRLR